MGIQWRAVAVALAAITVGHSAYAESVSVFLDKDHQGKGNKGTSFRPVDEFGDSALFVMTAMSSIDPASPFDPYASGLLGTVYINKKGAGVQTASAHGSKGISGGGGHKDEELIFTFDQAVTAASIKLGLIDFKAGSGLNDKDDSVLFIRLAGDPTPVVMDEIDYLGAFTSTGSKKGFIDFALLGLGDVQVDSFGIRETNGHIEVNMVSASMIPLPAGLLLGLVGMGGVVVARRRRTARSK